MSYVLGYIVADGNIGVRKKAKYNPLILNITSRDKRHLDRIKKVLNSKHKISKKPSGNSEKTAYQIQISNPNITNDLTKLGILPRKTYNLNFIKIPKKFFSDFVRGFFDGDGTVYIYRVNRTSQIKASFGNPTPSFFTEFCRELCKRLIIPPKTIHEDMGSRRKIPFYYIDFYIDGCKKLAEFMYGSNPTLYLPRKRRVFERWKSIKRRHYIKRNYPSKIGWRLNQKVFAEKPSKNSHKS